MSHYLSDLLPDYLDRLKAFEGLRLEAYIPKGEPDQGIYTIGYGHRSTKLSKGDVITPERAEEYLQEDLSVIFERLRYSVGLALWRRMSAGQRTALVDFVYNLGLANFNRSTLKRKLLRDLSDTTIPAEFERWNKAGGRVLRGLTKRCKYRATIWCL